MNWNRPSHHSLESFAGNSYLFTTTHVTPVCCRVWQLHRQDFLKNFVCTPILTRSFVHCFEDKNVLAHEQTTVCWSARTRSRQELPGSADWLLLQRLQNFNFMERCNNLTNKTYMEFERNAFHTGPFPLLLSSSETRPIHRQAICNLLTWALIFICHISSVYIKYYL